MNSVIYRPAPACAQHVRKKFVFCLVLWVMGLVTAFSLTSLQQAIGAYTGTVNTGTVTISLSGVVFYDANQDAKLSNSEWAIGGVGIELFNANNPNTPVATTTVNSVGQYLFKDISPGTYDVRCTTEGNWLPVPGEIFGINSAPRTSGLATPYNSGEWEIENIVLNGGDQAILYNFAAGNYPIQLLSKRMLLASSGQLLVYAVPEPSTAAILMVAAIAIGVGMTGRRYFHQ